MRRTRRLHFILFVLCCLSLAVALSLYALQDNISFFYSPLEVKKFQEQHSALIGPGRRFRLGGLVEKGSLRKRPETMEVSFTVTDGVDRLSVLYRGLLPDLFREGQGVVATGSLNLDGVFIATELLAKHDEKYMPPEVAKSLERAKRQ